jgi:prepilin-type N-terminal cleavage/methylation domain-containing protein
MSRRGFTLVEMLVVLVVAAILASVLFGLFQLIEGSRVSLTENRIHTLRCELKVFVMKKGYAPAALEELAKTLEQPSLMKDGKFVDAWERPLEYRASGKEFKLWSCGPDGISGTADDIIYEKN